MKLSLVLSILLLFAGCVYYPNSNQQNNCDDACILEKKMSLILDTYTETDLIRLLGPPQHVYKLNRSKFITYSRSFTNSGVQSSVRCSKLPEYLRAQGMPNTVTCNSASSGPYTMSCTTTFEIQNNRIVFWRRDQVNPACTGWEISLPPGSLYRM